MQRELSQGGYITLNKGIIDQLVKMRDELKKFEKDGFEGFISISFKDIEELEGYEARIAVGPSEIFYERDMREENE